MIYEVPRTFDMGEFDGFAFEQEVVEQIPEAALRPTRFGGANPLPFKSMFPNMQHNGTIFIPSSYWVRGRGVSAARATKAYVTSKIRSAFNEWKKLGEGAYDDRKLLILPRRAGEQKGNDPTNTFPEDGVSIFMLIGANQ